LIIKDRPGHRSPLWAVANVLVRKLGGYGRLLLFGLVAGSLFLSGMLVGRAGLYGRVVKPLFTDSAYLIRWWQGRRSEPEHLTIDISYENYQLLEHNRAIALKRGVLLPDHRDQVPARVRYGDQTLRADVRLKGDLMDHWNEDYKWSLRVRLKGENSLFGMKQFSLNHPKTRSYLNEWVFHKLLEQEGFLALRYDFVTLTVNGRDLGVYALEEHFERSLIENNARRDGPIMRYNDFLFWEGSRTYNEAFYAAPIDAYQTRRLKVDSTYRHQFLVAKDLMEAFRRGQLSVAEVFDIDRLALLFAVCDLFGHHHATWYKNIRFYYNPITSILEPIGFDSQFIVDLSVELMEGEDTERSDWNPKAWIAMLLDDPAFFAEYIRCLVRITQPRYLENFLASIQPEMEQKLHVLYQDYPWYTFDKVGILYGNRRYIQRKLKPLHGIQAYLARVRGDRIELEIGNIHSLPIEIRGGVLADTLELALAHDLLLMTRNPMTPVQFERCSFTLPRHLEWNDSLASSLSVRYRVLGTESDRSEPVFPWRHVSDPFVEGDLFRQPATFRQMDFITVDDSRGRVMVKQGVWRLTRNLIIPPGYVVACGPGTTIELSDSAKILSHSPLQFTGTEANPVIIRSAAGSGQGLVVIDAGGLSTLEYVTFLQLANPRRGNWSLTGAVTFYRSPVQLRHCRFQGCQAEDALNVISTTFQVSHTLFDSNSADALDADYSQGTVGYCGFVQCGQDAIEASGSELQLTGIHADGIGGKALDVGEDSHARVDTIRIRRANVALASRDRSDLHVTFAEISESTIGCAVYQVRPQFGGAQLDIEQWRLTGIQEPYVLEDESALTVRGEAMRPNQNRLKDLLTGVKTGRAGP
jgi:hypothetical protein